MKRQPTDEQKAAAKVRREKFAHLGHQISAMTEEQRLALSCKVPTATVEGHVLSLHNQCLIALQREGVTLVGGFRQWKKAGRSVRKGEHGMMIWCATYASYKDETADPDHPGFIVGTVFDISQTEEKIV